MIFTKEELDKIAIHFILCTERTGSSLLSLMLNLNDKILSPSEEPFVLYFFEKYQKKTVWSEKEISNYVAEFFLMSEKNTTLYFSEREIFEKNLQRHRHFLNWNRLVKLTYLHFIDLEEKKKENIAVIIDKQIKYFFHLKALQRIFPEARYTILVRDVRDNIVSKKNRQLNWYQHPLFLSALWKDTYQQMVQLPLSSFQIIRYEDLMQNPSETLEKICDWYGVPYQTKMLKTEGKYQSLIEAKKNKLPPSFIKHLLQFHSGLNSPTDLKKIGQYKGYLSEIELKKIEMICCKELQKFGYELTNEPKIKFSFSSFYYTIIAKVYRNWLLNFYLILPFSVKIFLKKIGKKKATV